MENLISSLDQQLNNAFYLLAIILNPLIHICESGNVAYESVTRMLVTTVPETIGSYWQI
jgi:hypothetical protein